MDTCSARSPEVQYTAGCKSVAQPQRSIINSKSRPLHGQSELNSTTRMIIGTCTALVFRKAVGRVGRHIVFYSLTSPCFSSFGQTAGNRQPCDCGGISEQIPVFHKDVVCLHTNKTHLTHTRYKARTPNGPE